MMQYQRLSIGEERGRLLIADNASPDCAHLKQAAFKAQFEEDTGFYPGARARVPVAQAYDYLIAFKPLIENEFGVAWPPRGADLFYSLVTRPPASLQVIQRLPHFDGTETNTIAIVHYLFDTDQGGTGFYRHKLTGFESINAERVGPYMACLNNEFRDQHAVPQGYITASNTQFERILAVPAQYNRAILYRGHFLHSGQIGADIVLSTDPAKGRLTLNAFLDF
jgi:hypothetical protein